MPITVNAANFVRAETDRMFAGLAATAGDVNVLHHNRQPTPVDQQIVIRMNRDTLYSAGVVDIADGAVLTVPDAGDRYLSVMVVNQDHYINAVIHEPGDHELSVDEHDTDFVAVAARILVDPTDPSDLAAVAELQDGFFLKAGSARPFSAPDYDTESYNAARDAVLEVARLGWTDPPPPAFGRREVVDPVRHLLLTAAGWGGLPEEEAMYVVVEPGLPVGEYQLTVREVPVDAFWSISVYNRSGFFEPNDRGVYSVNSVTAVRDGDGDGSVTVRFGGPADTPNTIPLADGWNYVVRLYRPRSEVLDGSWTFPTLESRR
jgi:hypothetical protein